MQQALIEAAAVTRALKKRGGADEALRLVEHLPNRVALELLLGKPPLSAKQKQGMFVGVSYLCSVIFIVIMCVAPSPTGFAITFGMMFLPLVLNAWFTFAPILSRVERARTQALTLYLDRVYETDAVDALLQVCTRETTSAKTYSACLNVLKRLLPRLPESEAKALSPLARAFLIRTLEQYTVEHPILTLADASAMLLVLSASPDRRFRKLLRRLRKRPIFRELAEHLLTEQAPLLH